MSKRIARVVKPLAQSSTGGVALAHAAIVFVVAALCYLQTWQFEFTYVDDDQLILQSQAELSEPNALVHAFSRPYFRQGARDHSYYRPVVTATYVLDAAVHADHARGYHLTNLLLHAGVAALVALWLRGSLHSNGASLFGGLIFALHPVLAEAVAWVPGRPDVLMTGFSMLAWLSFRRGVDKPSLLIRAAHQMAWLLALLCKETALVLPLVWLLECRLVHRRPWRKLVPLWLWVGWALVLTSYLALRVHALSGAPGVFGMGIGVSVAASVFENAPVLVSSLGKFVFPLELSVLAVAQDTWLWPGVLALLVVAVVWQRKIIARENVVLAIVSYGFMMLPNLSASSKLVLENRLYLPLVPIVGLATLAFSAIDGRRERRLLVGGAVLAVLAGQTLSYLGAFRDRRSFALAAVRGSPHSSLAHKNLGLTFHAVGKIEKAEREYRTALQLDPSEPMAHNNLGTIWGARKQLAVAEREFRAEIAVNPTYAPAHHNLAALLHATHRDDEAVTHWQASLDTNHRDSTATRALYAYYASRGDSRAAQYKQLLEANSKPSLR